MTEKDSPAIDLFCLPHAGGSAAVFRDWSAILSPDIQVIPFELSGHGTRIAYPLARRIEPIVTEITDFILHRADKHFALFGHSMGALIAYEVTSRLELFQRPPDVLFVAGHRAPHSPQREAAIYPLPDEALIAHLRKLGGVPDEIWSEPELVSFILPIIRADLEVCETYQFVPRSPLSCPIVAFGGKEDQFVTANDLEAWRLHATAPFRWQMFSGGHFFLNEHLISIIDSIRSEFRPLTQSRR